MSSSQRSESKKETINADSWVELHYPRTPPGEVKANRSPPHPLSLCGGQMEELLLEAQRDAAGQMSSGQVSWASSRASSRAGNASVASSRASSRGSPKSPHSPHHEMAPTLGLVEISALQSGRGVREEGNSDWIWDWSSRPEMQPPSDHGCQLYHPVSVTRPKLSMRNTCLMRKDGPSNFGSLTMIIFTHACTFVLGAAAMLIYLKKYCNLARSASN